jgi:hypothetical protein
MIRIHFGGFEHDRPVIPLALACGLGIAHAYGHRSNAIRRLCDNAPALWRAVPLDEAEIVVYPHRYTDDQRTRQVADETRAAGVPLLFFEHGDIENPSLPSYGTVYRTALDSRRRQPREFAMSGLSDDMLDGPEQPVVPLAFSPRPSVGFCGNVSGLIGDLKEALQGRWHVLHATRLRRRALAALRSQRNVDGRFLLRTRYWGGTVSASRGKVAVDDHQRSTKLRAEFVGNILENGYTLCVRGAGNYSIRFYEVLSAGRIPLFLDSHCVLPFSDEIDWKKHCVWVPEADIDRGGEILTEFHSKLGPAGFAELQRDNRRIWLEYLEATAFYRRTIRAALDA